MPTWTKPVTLTANANENVNDLNAILDDIYARANGGIDETNAPNLTAAFTTYKRLERAAGLFTGGFVAGTYLIPAHAAIAVNNIPAPGAVGARPADFLIELDPVLYAANTRTTKLRLQLTVITTTTAPAITFTAGLYPIATYGTSGSVPVIQTLGAVVSGSTAAVATPPISARTKTDGTDFNFPAAGAYVIAIALSGTPAGIVDVITQLEMRQV